MTKKCCNFFSRASFFIRFFLKINSSARSLHFWGKLSPSSSVGVPQNYIKSIGEKKISLFEIKTTFWFGDWKLDFYSQKSSSGHKRHRKWVFQIAVNICRWLGLITSKNNCVKMGLVKLGIELMQLYQVLLTTDCCLENTCYFRVISSILFAFNIERFFPSIFQPKHSQGRIIIYGLSHT